jgi:uncharacterized protein
MIATLVSAFMLGLLGSTHCVGMCGGFACSMCYAKPQQLFLFYNLGRITTYTLLGFITGLVGVYISHALGTVYFLRNIAGIMIILTGIYVSGLCNPLAKLEMLGKRFWTPLSRYTRFFLPVTNGRRAFFLGTLWGLLPCGLVYSALIFSLSASNWLEGILVMMLFGLGTLPALLLVGSSIHRFQQFFTGRLVRRMIGMMLVIMGVLSIFYTSHHAAMYLKMTCR